MKDKVEGYIGKWDAYRLKASYNKPPDIHDFSYAVTFDLNDLYELFVKGGGKVIAAFNQNTVEFKLIGSVGPLDGEIDVDELT